MSCTAHYLAAPFDPSTAATVNFPLGAVSSQTQLTTAVNSIPYLAGSSMLSVGLQKIATQVFNTSNGARPSSANIPRVLVVITDGKAQYQFEPLVRLTWRVSLRLTRHNRPRPRC